MDVRNCRGCGKLFNYVSGPFMCPACREKMEEKFQEVKKYIQENPGSNVASTAEACDVDPNQIRQWIREERLEFASGASEISCEKCGKLIHLHCEELEGIGEHLLKDHGFTLNSMRTVLYGICEDCAGKN